MERLRRRLAILGLVLASALPNVARADTDAARLHFEAGKRLRDDGDCAHAIAEFGLSLAAEASIGAYYNLGYCQEQLTSRQAAYDAYRRAQQLASAKHDERIREIGGALAALLETPHVRLLLPRPLPPGLRVVVDGQAVADSAHAAEAVVFTRGGGVHAVSVTAPGYEETRVHVATGELQAIELRPLGTQEQPALSLDATTAGSPSDRRWLGLGLAAGGVVGGVVTTLLVLDHRSNVDDLQATYERERDRCPRASTGFPERSCETVARGRRNEETSSENERIVVTGGLVGAAALALLVSGGVIFLDSARRAKGTADATPTLRFAPRVTATDRAVMVFGTF